MDIPQHTSLILLKNVIASGVQQSRPLLRSNNPKQFIDNIKNCSAILPGLLRPLSGLARQIIVFLQQKNLKVSMRQCLSGRPGGISQRDLPVR